MDAKKTAAPIEKAAATEVKSEKVAATEAVVLDSTGQTVRIYSLADHGDNFEELAEQFISHHPGKTVRVR